MSADSAYAEAFSAIDGAAVIRQCCEFRASLKGRVQQPLQMAFQPQASLPDGWAWSSVSQICERVSVGHVGPTSKHFCDDDDGVLLIRSQNVRPGHVDLSECVKVTKQFHETLKKSQLRNGDVLIVRVGANRSDTATLSSQNGPINCANIVFARPFFANGFLSYYLQSPIGRDTLLSLSTGAAQGVINTTAVASMPVPVPPLPTQQRIAAILSAYDNLIETNTRRIAILEEMARRLYEEWFVHFRFPGHEATEFDGDLPRGWPAVELAELVQINPRTTVPRDGVKPFVPMGALSETSMVIDGVEQRSGNSGTKFQNADTLVARITPCLENGKTGFVDFLDEERPVAFGSTEFIVLRPLTLGPCAIYCLARSHAFRDVAIKSMSGAEGRQRVRPESVQKYPIAQPPADLIDRFERIASPMFSRVSLLARQNANLRAQRDLLLPKLVTGEIDVSGSEAALEAAE